VLDINDGERTAQALKRIEGKRLTAGGPARIGYRKQAAETIGALARTQLLVY
jgi:hypothetical protein